MAMAAPASCTGALRGVVVAMLTPFASAGAIDVPALRAYTDWLIVKGVHALFPGGTTGEGPALTVKQRRLLMESVVDAAAGRVPVVPMTGAISTEETLELTRHARQVGADSAAVVAPWYFAHDEASLEAHFSAAAEAVPDFPLYLYNIPANARNEIKPGLAARLMQRYPHIQGVKDSSKSLETLRAFLAMLPGKTVLVGTDALLVDALEAGTGGVVSAVAACFPEVMLDIHRAHAAGDAAQARERQAFANQVRDALKTGPYLHPYKLALRWQGLRFSGMRAPLRECTGAEAETVRLALTRLGLLHG